MIAEDFGPVYTRGQKTREGTASAVCTGTIVRIAVNFLKP